MSLQGLVSLGGVMRGSDYLIAAHTTFSTRKTAVDWAEALHGFTRPNRRESLKDHHDFGFRWIYVNKVQDHGV